MPHVPPWLVRRLVVDPLFFLIALAGVLVSPLVLLISAVVDVVLPGRLRTTRLLALGVVYLACEAVALVVLFALWIRGGFGFAMSSAKVEELHHRFLRWWLSRLIGAATKLLGIKIELDEPQAPRAGAVLVFPRHAGPGDSMLIAQLLMVAYSRRPRVVMKDTMQWAPTIDIVGNRLGGCFIRPADRRANRFIERIGELADGLGDQDAFVLFPEGGNFTLRRRDAAIEKLRTQGHDAHAEQAEQMQHVLAPRPGGALAAIAASPHADVVFVAHTGLEALSSMGALWRALPLREPIVGRYWRLAPSEVPDGRDAQIDWLYTWWGTIDTWIGSRARPDEA